MIEGENKPEFSIHRGDAFAPQRIRFSLADGIEILRIEGDGTLLHKGRKIECDDELRAGLREFLRGVGCIPALNREPEPR